MTTKQQSTDHRSFPFFLRDASPEGTLFEWAADERPIRMLATRPTIDEAVFWTRPPQASLLCHDVLELQLSDNHRLRIPGRATVLATIEGSPAVVEAHALDPASDVLVARQVGFYPEILNTHLSTAGTRGVYRLHKQITLGKGFGYFLGAMVGNGCAVHKEGRLAAGQLTDDSAAVQARVAACVRQLFEDPEKMPKGRFSSKYCEYGPTEHLVFHSAGLAEIIAAQIGCGSENKHLPPSFLEAPEVFRQGLLAGLMDTDGTAWRAKEDNSLGVSYSTTSLRLAREIGVLAATLGIPANLAYNDHKNNERARLREHSVIFQPRAFLSALPNLGMVKLHKLENLEDPSAQVSSFRDLVPLPKPTEDLIGVLLRKATRSWLPPSRLTHTARNGAVARPVLQGWLEAITHAGLWEDALSGIAAVANARSVSWERLRAVHPISEPMAWPTGTQDELYLLANRYRVGAVRAANEVAAAAAA